MTVKGLFISMDPNSGGYPYETSSPLSAYVWYNKDQAIDYGIKFGLRDHHWILKEVCGLVVEDVDTEHHTL